MNVGRDITRQNYAYMFFIANQQGEHIEQTVFATHIMYIGFKSFIVLIEIIRSCGYWGKIGPKYHILQACVSAGVHTGKHTSPEICSRRMAPVHHSEN